MATQGRRRALGQHFLKDRAIASQIADTAIREAVKAGAGALLEIGPGKGAITEPLLAGLAGYPEIRFMLCERDRQLAHEWLTRAKDSPSPFTVESADFLELPEEAWLSVTPLAVASNLPYSVGTAIVTRLARFPEKIPVMVLMFQAEVAHRLRAVPSTKDWGSLSVWIQNRWEVTQLLAVPPGAFVPPPQVQSEVVLLKARQTPLIEVSPDQEKAWEGLLRTAFAHRRKMLRSGLPGSGLYRNALELSQVDGTKRAEALSWEEWGRLFKAVLRVLDTQ